MPFLARDFLEDCLTSLSDPKSIVVSEVTKKPHSVRDNSNGKVYNEKNTTKEGLIRGESRQETREAFLRRAVQTVLQVETRGKTAYGYRRTSPADVTERSRSAEEELKKLGIPSVVYDVLEVNQSGRWGAFLCYEASGLEEKPSKIRIALLAVALIAFVYLRIIGEL